MSDDKKKLTVGDECVVYGNVPSGTIGNRSTVIGPTDNQGNTVINQPTAIGYNANAIGDSVVFGVNAEAGSELGVALAQLRGIIDTTKDQQLIKAFSDLCHELGKTQKDKTRITQLWNIVKTAATLNGAIGLISTIGKLI